jgi:hypothetical protein
MLQKLGRYFDADPAEADKLAQEHPLLAACCAASLQGSVAMGPRAGQRVLRGGAFVEHDADRAHGPAHGFNLHAGLRVAAKDNKGRERVLHYILRPPIATKRLTRGKDGRVTYWLKEPWADGSKCVIFEPLDFIAKLLPLIPPPRANLTRYHGAWAPHAAIRDRVVPVSTARASQLPLPLGGGGPQRAAAGGGGGAKRDHRAGGERQRRARPDKIPWSDLAKRTFEIDTLLCPRCAHSPMRVIAVIAAPTREQLAALRGGGDVVAVRPERSRAPPAGQMRFEFARVEA